MNLDYDDGRMTCSNCGTKYFPEVGMSPCPGCSGRMTGNKEVVEEYNDGIRWQNKPRHSSNKSSNWQAQPKVAPPDSSWISYVFIKRQTDKAILFAFQSGKGLFEHWVPKSVITGLQQDPNRVKIQQWFVMRNSLNV